MKKTIPKELYGVPLEEMDDNYKNDYVSMLRLSLLIFKKLLVISMR